MPLLKLETTVALSDEKQKALLASLSKIVAETIGKPEQYVMITASQTDILMGGRPGEAAFVQVRSIGGLEGGIPKLLSKRICALLNEAAGIPQERVYLNFTDVQDAHWGWKGSTFD